MTMPYRHIEIHEGDGRAKEIRQINVQRRAARTDTASGGG